MVSFESSNTCQERCPETLCALQRSSHRQRLSRDIVAQGQKPAHIS